MNETKLFSSSFFFTHRDDCYFFSPNHSLCVFSPLVIDLCQREREKKKDQNCGRKTIDE